CGYSAAEKCDEVPPPHGLTPRPGSRRTITGLEWVGGVHHSKKGRPMSAMGYPRPRVKAAPRRLSALPESDLHKSRCDPPLRAIRVLTHRRIRRFSSLLIEVLGWRHVSRRRDTVAALTDAGVALINNDRRRRGIGSGGVRTQRVEACLLFVAKPVVEFRECGLHGRHCTVRGFKPLLHGLDAARGRGCRIDRAISHKPLCRLGGHISQFVERRALR